MTYDPVAHGAACSRCPLRDSIPVPPEPHRSGKPKLVIIGESPGRWEVIKQRPFIGASGKMLDAELAAAGFDRRDAHVTNAVLCDPESNKQMLEGAIPCCAPRLAGELAALDKSIPILSLGAGASRFTIGRGGIQKYRGFVWKAPEIKPAQLSNSKRLYEKRAGIIAMNKRGEKKKSSPAKVKKALDSWELLKARAVISGRFVLPTVHPAFILRGAHAWLPVMRGDIARAMRIIQFGEKLQLADKGAFVFTSDPRKAERLIARMSDTVTVDIESDGIDPMRCSIDDKCVGICDVKDIKNIVVIGPWSDKRHAPVLRRQLKHRTVVTHNGPPFDNIALALRGIFYKKNEDTLVAHRTMFSHMPQSLAHVASVYMDVGPWKIKFKGNEEKAAVAGLGVRDEDLPEYNAADVRTDAIAWTRMQPELNRERALYEEDMQMAALYSKMQMRGILVDGERRARLSRKLRFRAHALVGEMRKLLHRRGFSPSRPNDVRKALFGQLKAPMWLAPMTPTGLPSTAAIVLENLREQETRAGKLADYIVRWRSANDSRSEYLDGIHIHTDGRIHPTWKQVETGRPATRNPNVLNLPRMAYCKGCGVKLLDGCVHGKKKVVDGVETFVECKKKQEPQPEEQLRDIYVCRPGYKFVYFDLSQAEMRFAAHISGDPVFMKSCEGDIHVENACILFPDGADKIRADPKGFGYDLRQIAKSMGFAVAYLAEAPTVFSRMHGEGYNVGMDEVESMLDNLHTSYRVYYKYCEDQWKLACERGWIRIPISNRIRWVGHFPKINQIANTPTQGGVAAVMNKRLLAMEKRKPPGADLIYYWYDAAIYETPDAEVQSMEEVIRATWDEEILIPHNGIKFKQKIDFKIGERLSDF